MTQGATSPLIDIEDLLPFASIDAVKAQLMIDDAVAMAVLVAPCINSDDFEHPQAVRAILRGAILRWNEAGSGAVQSQSLGPYSMSTDTRQQRRGMFWPSEIEQLQSLCATTAPKAFSIDTAGGVSGGHVPWCNLMFGANYCSCGADIGDGVPLYEGGLLTGGD